ncbi:trichothecene efflux pump [Aspergillus homomorphus CBS 101889]|uniref:Siderophore iron transporter n=1 Tax=Aspergillus homomorphus (strain CBS 101889) TaxID=1450537 RepID=A0A395I4M4_ASPHC|nr:siderophore iron transporter [Aspergillus homomorphus CBS 101889]RAL14138.1 siderophore iron transporter [Aspergillus homomorphus CBS 101889]
MADEKTPQPVEGSIQSRSMDLNQLPAGYYWSPNFIGSLIAGCLMAISLYLGYVLPVNSLTAINKDLGPDPNYSMISTVFTLISGVGLLLVGRLGDIFGRRYILIGGQLLGLIGAIVCATAKTVPTVIGGSVLCGLAAAVQLTFTFVIAELVPNRARPVVNAGIFITTLPFSAFGSIIASDFIANTAASWRWTYYLNMITCGLSIILLVLFYFPPGWDRKRGSQSRLDGLKKFDIIGFVLYAGGIVLILLGLSWGGTSYAWDSAHVVAVLVIGFVSVIAFVIYEIYAPLEQPLLPMSLLRNPGYAATVCSALVGNMVYFSMSLLWPQAVLHMFTTNSIKAGWLSISTGVGVIIGEIAGGVLMKPLGFTKYQLIASTVTITAFSGALAAINQHRQAYGIAFTAIGGFAVGYLELITIIMCPLYCKPEDIGLASGFLGSAKQIFGTIATAIYVAILQNRITANMPGTVSGAATKAGLPASSVTDLLEAIGAGTSAALEAVPGMTSKILAAVADAQKTAYAESFRTVFCVSIAFGGLSIIASLFSKEVDTRLDGGVAAKLVVKEDSSAAWEKGGADEEAH